MFSRASGFTVIELLVVIAIIAILVVTILPRLQGARTDGLEVKIKAELNLLWKRAAVEENKSLTYDVVCGSNGIAQATAITEQIAAIEAFTGEVIVCNSQTKEYAVSTVLSSTTHWCVDSAGKSLERATDLTSSEYSCE